MVHDPKATESRKSEHVKLVLNENVQALSKTNGLEEVQFLHYALPEMNFSEVDVSAKFLGKNLKAPLIVTGMTGGYGDAEKINKDIAEACGEQGIVFGVGSQRAMIEKPELKRTYRVRDVAPNVFLCGNVGGYQLRKYSFKQIESLISSIEADALCVHLNPLQELMQPEGDRGWKGVLSCIEKLCSEVSIPVIVKETGAGINDEVAVELERAGVKAIDVSGAGGTSWSAVELHRAGMKERKEFWDWGIPTKQALEQCRKAIKLPLIASGGLRSGMDVAKCIRLGANLAGAAYPFIKAQDTLGVKGVSEEISLWVRELKTAMLLTRSQNLEELRRARLL